jgi:hypothetical protein
MGVIGQECPCIALGLGFRKENRQPFNEVFSVPVIIEDLTPFYSSDHDMMQKAGCV